MLLIKRFPVKRNHEKFIGFNTAKGDLIRSILFPKPVDFKFYNDSLKFIGFLAIIASLGMIYGAAVYIRRKVFQTSLFISGILLL